jgi:hypothetical protein
MSGYKALSVVCDGQSWLMTLYAVPVGHTAVWFREGRLNAKTS